jgi:hypothetical protein
VGLFERVLGQWSRWRQSRLYEPSGASNRLCVIAVCAARFPLSVSSLDGSMSVAKKLVKSAATWSSLRRSTEASVGASTGVSGGVFADGVYLHPTRKRSVRSQLKARMQHRCSSALRCGGFWSFQHAVIPVTCKGDTGITHTGFSVGGAGKRIRESGQAAQTPLKNFFLRRLRE